MLVCRVMCFSQTTYILSPISDTEGKVQMGNNQSRSPLWNIILSFCSVYLPLYKIAIYFCLRVYWRYNSFSLLFLTKLCRIFYFFSVRGMAVSILSFTTMIWSHMHSLSNREWGRWLRPNNSFKWGYSECGTDAFYFCLEVFRQ